MEHIGFGVGEPSAHKRSVGGIRPVHDEVGEALTSGRGGDKRKDIHLRIPKHFRNMREDPGEVFMGHGELLCSCNASAPF